MAKLKTGFYNACGKWNDTKETFTAIVFRGTRAQIDRHFDNDKVFYYFEIDEDIKGNHGDFTITSYQKI